MSDLPDKLIDKLHKRRENGTLRSLSYKDFPIDFYSNDYLGLACDMSVYNTAQQMVIESKLKNGSGGSRLLSGNHPLYKKTEEYLQEFYRADEALIFQSGYAANLGLLSSLLQREDIILYDEYSHASIRDGIALSGVKAYKFRHNNLEDIQRLFAHSNIAKCTGSVYLIVEGVYSMDGDIADLTAIYQCCAQQNVRLIVDEAHAVGVIGEGKGLVCNQGLEKKVFARIVTFGKALGCHGAVVLGTQSLKEYLINFARSLIYTTALSPHDVATIWATHQQLLQSDKRQRLLKVMTHFEKTCKALSLEHYFISNQSAIRSFLPPKSICIADIASQLQSKGYGIKAIYPPTVPQEKSRLRFCLHSYNSLSELEAVLKSLSTFVR